MTAADTELGGGRRLEYPAWTRAVNPLLSWGRLCFRYDYGKEAYVSGPMSAYVGWTLEVRDVVPAVACSSPSTRRATVLLPQPDSPTIPSVRPGLIANDIPSTATRLP